MNHEPIKIFLDKNAHRYAQQFAKEQINPQKGKQVYLNTLAVCAVNSYLKMLSIDTSLDRSYCWHPIYRSIFDTADLVLPKIGKLECRPLLPGETTFLLPPEVIEDRIGYLAVRFKEQLDEVELLGFINSGAIANDLEPIFLDRLQSLDTLIDRIYRQKPSIDLGQWLRNVFNREWQPTELLLANNSSFRSATVIKERSDRKVDRAKVITLENADNSTQVILVVSVEAKSDRDINIDLRIYPSQEDNYLPSQLKVNILDDINNNCLATETRDKDNYLHLEFSCHSEEGFSISIDWQEINYLENFIYD
jgi:Protein of unknown function (DUF1822)